MQIEGYSKKGQKCYVCAEDKLSLTLLPLQQFTVRNDNVMSLQIVYTSNSQPLVVQ